MIPRRWKEILQRVVIAQKACPSPRQSADIQSLLSGRHATVMFTNVSGYQLTERMDPGCTAYKR
jgi:hypothetical protein